MTTLTRRQRRKKMFRALNGVITFVRTYHFEPVLTTEELKYARSPDMDQEFLGTSYEAESTSDLSKRTKCRHPSYAVHNVSWAQFLNTDARPKIRESVLEKRKDALILSEVLSATECEALIHLSERHGYAMLISAENGGTGRTNTRMLTHDESLAAILYERMKAFLPQSFRMTDGRMWDEEWELVGLNERFRWCKYVEGQSFQNIHCDKRVSLREQGRYSFFTVNIYLNGHGAGYRGGRTIFYDESGRSGKSPEYEESSAFSARTGEVMVFNHFPQKYPHCGEMLSAGTKYLLRSDVMYKRRRTR